MKTTASTESGIQIENTLSMSLQKKVTNDWKLCWPVIVLSGIIGSIFTFVSMFHPQINLPAMISVVLLSFAIFTFMAFHPKKYLRTKVFLVVIYLAILLLLHKSFYAGFVHMMNAICKEIYDTDWNYFSAYGEYSERYATTVFLALCSVVIVFAICHAVIRYQNFLLTMLVTFPYIELGFYFGIAPNHLLGSLLFAFWCSVAAMHLSNFGAYQEFQKANFLRKDNTFFPVSGMRFMVTEKVGFFVLLIVFVLSLLSELILMAAGYSRPDEFKKLRTDVKEYIENVDFPDVSNPIDFFPENQEPETKHEDTIALGETDARNFENVSISQITLTAHPDCRLYLKFDTGHQYTGHSWNLLYDSVYEAAIFETFEEDAFYPQDFLWASMEQYHDLTTMMIREESPILSQCVPYGHEPNADLSYVYDYGYDRFSTEYTMRVTGDYEALLLAGNCNPSDDILMYEDDGYRSFVEKQYLELPFNSEILDIEYEYEDLFAGYDYETASPDETIELLQLLRTKMCSEVSYTLSPGRTPEDADFAAYFLLESQAGYCEHYATAGTILARMAGIPARYCQGFMVDCTSGSKSLTETPDGYTANVLDSNAHAWTEIYLRGIGWIPFEFTFSYFDDSDIVLPQDVTEKPTRPHIEETTEKKHTTPSPTGPDEETTAAAVTPDASSERQNSGMVSLVIGIAVFFLLLALLITLFILSERAERNRRMRKLTQKNREAAARFAYRYLCRLLKHCGADVTIVSVQKLTENALFYCGRMVQDGSIEACIAIGAKIRFSPHSIEEEELTILRKTAMEIAGTIDRESNPLQRWKLRYLQHLI